MSFIIFGFRQNMRKTDIKPMQALRSDYVFLIFYIYNLTDIKYNSGSTFPSICAKIAAT